MHARLLFASLALSACTQTPTPPREQNPTASSAPPSSILSPPAPSSSAADTPSDPPAPAGDLRAEIDRFASLDQCVAEHAALDPLVADSLGAIGYDTFLRDSCRLLEALKEKRTDACALIAASSLRERCDVFVAMATANAEMCPLVANDRPALGHDPMCVAIASRDPRLCAGAVATDRATCEALAAKDGARCAGAFGESAKSACTREVTRWKNVVDGAKSGLAKLAAVRAHMTIHEADADAGVLDTDLSADFSRGIVVTKLRDGLHVTLGTPHDLDATALAASPAMRPRIALSFALPDAAPNAHAAARVAKLEHLEINLPGEATLVFPGVLYDGAISITKLDVARGGDVAIKFVGTVGAPPHAHDVTADIATFVRDVVTK